MGQTVEIVMRSGRTDRVEIPVNQFVIGKNFNGKRFHGVDDPIVGGEPIAEKKNPFERMTRKIDVRKIRAVGTGRFARNGKTAVRSLCGFQVINGGPLYL